MVVGTTKAPAADAAQAAGDALFTAQFVHVLKAEAPIAPGPFQPVAVLNKATVVPVPVEKLANVEGLVMVTSVA